MGVCCPWLRLHTPQGRESEPRDHFERLGAWRAIQERHRFGALRLDPKTKKSAPETWEQASSQVLAVGGVSPRRIQQSFAFFLLMICLIYGDARSQREERTKERSAYERREEKKEREKKIFGMECVWAILFKLN